MGTGKKVRFATLRMAFKFKLVWFKKKTEVNALLNMYGMAWGFKPLSLYSLLIWSWWIPLVDFPSFPLTFPLTGCGSTALIFLFRCGWASKRSATRAAGMRIQSLWFARPRMAQGPPHRHYICWEKNNTLGLSVGKESSFFYRNNCQKTHQQGSTKRVEVFHP